VEGWNLLDSLYFSVVTLTTIGYGDLSPSTAASKIFTIFYIFVGLGIILAFVNTVAERAMERRRKSKDSDRIDPGRRHGERLSGTPIEVLSHQRRRSSLLAWRFGEGQRSCGTIRIMKSKTLAHWRTASIEGGKLRENSLSLANLRSWVLVKIGLSTLLTLLPCPSNA